VYNDHINQGDAEMNKAEAKKKLELAEKNYSNISKLKGKKRQEAIDEYEYWSNKYAYYCNS